MIVARVVGELSEGEKKNIQKRKMNEKLMNPINEACIPGQGPQGIDNSSPF